MSVQCHLPLISDVVVIKLIHFTRLKGKSGEKHPPIGRQWLGKLTSKRNLIYQTQLIMAVVILCLINEVEKGISFFPSCVFIILIFSSQNIVQK